MGSIKNHPGASRRIWLTGLLLVIMSAGISEAQPGNKSKADSLKAAISDSLLPNLVVKVAAYSSTIDHTDFLVRRKYNVTPISLDLPEMERKLNGFKSRLAKRGGQMNLRGLNSSVIMLKEISDDLAAFQNVLTRYQAELKQSNSEVQKILADPLLKMSVPDAILQEQIRDINLEGRSLDSLERLTLSKINLLHNRVSVDFLQATDVISDMRYLTISLKMGMWGQEEDPLFRAKPADYRRSLGENTLNALSRSSKIISIYVAANWDILTLGILLFVFLFAWILLNKRRIQKQPNANVVLEPVPLLRRSVLLACLFAFFTYLPFLFANPVMSFLHACEALRLGFLAFLVYPFLTRSARPTALALLLVWICYALDDILLESAYGERWGLFFAGCALSALLVKIFLDKKPHFRQLVESPATRALAFFCLIQALLSIVMNLAGRVSLAKIFGVSAVQCMMLGISLKVFSTIVLEAIYLQSEAFHDSRFSDFINYKTLQHRFLRVLGTLATIIFAISLVRNMTLYDAMMQWLSVFFHTTRSIGSMVFTYKNVAVFVCIIWLSSVISEMINFFFGNQEMKTGKRSKLASMMLLIRLAIWTLGFCIAVAAAGIPVDKISLMLGALGVGIGFGLQNIVNNLVSGVIIAFERPIQVGDLIEVGGKQGVVKEIGVRSSKINNNEGADIIVPNGDLLSQHLINWTMQDRSKQVDFIIGIPYEADIRNLREAIMETLANNERILKTHIPVVALQDFGPLAVELKISFWVNDLSEASSIRTGAMQDIYEMLASRGIRLSVYRATTPEDLLAKPQLPKTE